MTGGPGTTLTGGTTGERTTGETSAETVNSAAAKEGLAALKTALGIPPVSAQDKTGCFFPAREA
jgi:hypothetical protein